MTPLKIEILLHYYYSVNRDYPNLEAPAVAEAVAEFVSLGLLYECPPGNSTKFVGNGQALTVYVDALCKVPLPKLVWA